MERKSLGLIALLVLLSGCGSSGDSGSRDSAAGSNQQPTANAGADQSVQVGDTVALSGAASSDADGDTLGYSWSFVSRPSGSASVLSSATSLSASFVADVAGSYLVALVVNDGALSSTSDSVLVTASESSNPSYSGTGFLTQGLATTQVTNLFAQGSRVAALGSIDDEAQQSWVVPGANAYSSASLPFAPDLYNPYVSGHDYADADAALAALDGSEVVVVDADGELITAYIFADNYFELYVNGTPVGKDPVPYTEFNANIVRFRVKQPFTVAMLLLDWEEHLGTGTENNQGSANFPGDGGMVAVFQDASGATIGVTDASWRAQTFYTAPITDLTCLSESGQQRLSTGCSTSAPSDLGEVYAVHWSRPDDWMSSSFDDSAWPLATTFTNATVGVDNKPAYTRFTALFDDAEEDAQFIWSSNLVLDNEVVVRGTLGSADSGSGGTEEGTLQLSSKAVKADGILPLSATCEGADQGHSLTLDWSGAPAGTQSFALAMYHFPNPADAPDYSKAHYYWSLYDIPATTSGLDEGESDIGTFGINSVDGQQSYTAPCSQGPGDKEYSITLFALSAPVGSLSLVGSVTDLATLTSTVAPYVLESASLTLIRERYNSNEDLHVPSAVADTCAAKSAAFDAYSDFVSVSCDADTFSVTSQTQLPYRSELDVDKPNVGIRSWIGRVPIPETSVWSLPIVPTYLSAPASNINIHHPIGISVDGIPILSYIKEGDASEVAQLGQDYSDRDTLILGEVDQCGGHAGNGEDYHYHAAPICLMDSHDPSQPLAYMFDGLPLYFGTGGGVLSTDGTDYGGGRYSELNYLPQKVKTGERPLDACNAYDLNGDGSAYVYYSTAEPPYAIGCYRAQADQAASVFAGPHWSEERDLAWSGSQVALTDDDTLTFDGQTWHFIEITPADGNNKIASGDTALILYRQLTATDADYDPSANCYAFRYRLDSTDTAGSNDTTAVHCR